MQYKGNKITVLYVVGVGRSGSTILDILLGDHAQLESVGELINVNSSAWIKDEFCSCHNKASECEFWVRVKAVWLEKSGVTDLTEYSQLQDQFEFCLYKPSRLQKAADADPKAYERFLQLTELMYVAISEVSGRSVIVDSSKSRVRGYHLAKLPKLDLHFVHLIRDTRDIINSLRKTHAPDLENGVQQPLRSLPGWRTSLSWILANLQTHHLIKHYSDGRYCVIKYEDLLEFPEIAIGKIQAMLDIDLSSVIKSAQTGRALDVGHTVAGNRLRMQDTVSFNAKKPAIKKLSAIDTLSFSVFAYWLARQYGYPFTRKE